MNTAEEALKLLTGNSICVLDAKKVDESEDCPSGIIDKLKKIHNLLMTNYFT
jgi:hypothetical protein